MLRVQPADRIALYKVRWCEARVRRLELVLDREIVTLVSGV
jgi:hypothetical protein